MSEYEIKGNLEGISKEYNSDELGSYFKYCSDDDAVIDGIFKENKIRFTQPRALNDPLEFNPTLVFKDSNSYYQMYELNGFIMPNIELIMRVQIIEPEINNFGILSLTKTPDSFDMWSRYSSGHRGFMIEFKEDFWQHQCMKSQTENPYGLKKIEYVEDYSINLENFVNENDGISIQAVLDYLFYKKLSYWKCENEYRMVRPLMDCLDYKHPKSRYSYAYSDLGKYLFHFDWECINSMVLGAMMSKENKRLISKCCEAHNIHLFQAHIIRNKMSKFNMPKIIPVELNDTEYRNYCIECEPYMFITDTYKLGKPKVNKINNLSDLPYYVDYKTIIEQYYKNIKSGKQIRN